MSLEEREARLMERLGLRVVESGRGSLISEGEQVQTDGRLI